MTYTMKRADEISSGDAVLCRYYDEAGALVEQDWIVRGVGARRYGRGLRVTLSFTAPGFTTPAVYDYAGSKTLPVRDVLRCVCSHPYGSHSLNGCDQCGCEDYWTREPGSKITVQRKRGNRTP